MAANGDIRATRKHKILQQRQKQLAYNLMVRYGGDPYIDARLTRHPCESDASWSGTVGTSSLKETKWSSNWYKGDSGGVIGRKDRAFLLNYASRIVTKINQYVFGQDVQRDGIDQSFALDVTKTGLSIGSFMEEVSAVLTCGGWCWVGVDRAALPVDPQTGQPTQRSIAQREADGDRVWWSLWEPTEVVDWRFDGDGNLERLITQQVHYDNSNLMQEPTEQKIRTIWEPGRGQRLWINKEDDTKIDRIQSFTIGAKVVPFICLGVPSSAPHWMDDVERVQASLLNLESAHHENLIQSVFPQLVLPHNIIEDIMRLCEIEGMEGYQRALEMVRGLSYPILEPGESKGVSRYLTPASGDLEAIPKEILRRRKELMDIVGLAMQDNDSKAAKSADSKAWDNLDPSTTLRKRAILLEEAENKLIALSKKLDSTFGEYEPEYPRQFDIPNAAQDVATLVQLGNLNLPDAGQREILKASMKVLGSIVSIPKDRMQDVMEQIDEMDMSDVVSMARELAGENFAVE